MDYQHDPKRPLRRLTKADRRDLQELRRRMLDAISTICSRLDVDEQDDHWNSWWRNYEAKVDQELRSLSTLVYLYRNNQTANQAREAAENVAKRQGKS
jgi:hypothetical protein